MDEKIEENRKKRLEGRPQTFIEKLMKKEGII